MFEWLLGIKCKFCDIRIPRNFKLIHNTEDEFNYCSQKCYESFNEIYNILNDDDETIPNTLSDEQEEILHKYGLLAVERNNLMKNFFNKKETLGGT